MHSRTAYVSIRLQVHHAETLYWELLGLLDHYQTSKTRIDPCDEAALRSTAAQLDSGIKRIEAVAAHELNQLRAVTPLTA